MVSKYISGFESRFTLSAPAAATRSREESVVINYYHVSYLDLDASKSLDARASLGVV